MSLEVAKVIAHVKHNTGDQYTNAQIASSLAIICGIISAGIGFLRIGFILEFIPGNQVSKIFPSVSPVTDLWIA